MGSADARRALRCAASRSGSCGGRAFTDAALRLPRRDAPVRRSRRRADRAFPDRRAHGALARGPRQARAMTPFVEALERIARVLSVERLRFALIGGAAIVARVRPRFTQDLDLLVAMQRSDLDRLLAAAAREGYQYDPKDWPLFEEGLVHLAVDPARSRPRATDLEAPPVRVTVRAPVHPDVDLSAPIRPQLCSWTPPPPSDPARAAGPRRRRPTFTLASRPSRRRSRFKFPRRRLTAPQARRRADSLAPLETHRRTAAASTSAARGGPPRACCSAPPSSRARRSWRRACDRGRRASPRPRGSASRSR